MPEAKFSFPRDFLWGTSTSAHQVEGYNTNNWSDWEQGGHIVAGHSCGQACDWWGGRWREDFDRAAETGQNTHRFSIEWSRIQPAQNRWDEGALDYYRQMVRGLRERGLTPMVTLHHFTNPLWVEELGGWENDALIKSFETYVWRVVEGLHEYVDLWCTINEPNVFAASGYLLGDFPPGKTELGAVYRVIVNLIKAHAAAYHAIHEIQPQAQVGLAHQFRGFTPAKKWSPADKWAAGTLSNLFNEAIPTTLLTGKLRFLAIRKTISPAKNTQDFLGINYYTREYVAFNPFTPSNFFTKRFFNPEVEISSTGFIANEPQEFFKSLKWGLKFNLPIYVTENGIEDSEDALRRRYLIQHVHQLWRGVNYTWPIRGYYHWSLVDNFEWERGWTQRFGLWELDTQTQARTKRKSAELYETICRENALTSTQVQQFAPEIFEALFPG